MIWDTGLRVLARTSGLHSVLVRSIRKIVWLSSNTLRPGANFPLHQRRIHRFRKTDTPRCMEKVYGVHGRQVFFQ
jgi:hypothetical protein